jgi:hypothetical protein
VLDELCVRVGDVGEKDPQGFAAVGSGVFVIVAGIISKDFERGIGVHLNSLHVLYNVLAL